MLHYKNHKNGYTIVEVIIVLPIIVAIFVAFLVPLSMMMAESNDSKVRTSMAYDAQQALSLIEADSNLAAGYLATPDAGLNDANAPVGGWSYKGASATDRVLIMQVYATTTNPLDLNRSAVYQKLSTPTATNCGDVTSYTKNDPLTYNILYFVNNGSLYRRRLVNTVTPDRCQTIYQKQSCPDSANSASCMANGVVVRDEKLASNVSSFSIQYYSGADDSTELNNIYTSPTPATDVAAASRVQLNLTLQRRVSNGPSTYTSSIKVTKVNHL